MPIYLDIIPTVQKRWLPILIQKQVDTEEDKLLEISVIKPVTKSATWVNPLIIVAKKMSQ